MKAKIRNFYIIGDLVLLALIPFAIVAVRRYSYTTTPRFAIIQGMDRMPYLTPERRSSVFADDRAMRPHIAGTMAQQDFTFVNMAEARAYPDNWKKDHVAIRSGLQYDRIMLGQKLVHGQRQFITKIPIPVTRRLVLRGQQEFDIFCTPCHGFNGMGNGSVNQYVNKLRAAGSPDAGTWVKPADLTGPGVAFMPDGGIFSVITNGVAVMAAYKDQIPVVDRWAIVAYVRALQLSRKKVAVNRLPKSVRNQLKKMEREQRDK
ncbi:MAG: c-type cytochrome [Phycisphaerae bacterium]